METPPAPTQQQADEAQQARFQAENAILALFNASAIGGGSSENDVSILKSLKIAVILTALVGAVVAVSFRHPRDRSKSLLLVKPDSEQISDRMLSEAQSVFNKLAVSDLSNAQRAVLWATWAHSRASDEVAEAINSGDIPHEFSDGAMGRKLKKIWISRSDGRVRPLHVKLHGQAISVENDFWRWPATGQRLRWPGDREAPAEATIGCRCVCLLSWATQEEVSESIRRIVEHTTKTG